MWILFIGFVIGFFTAALIASNRSDSTLPVDDYLSFEYLKQDNERLKNAYRDVIKSLNDHNERIIGLVRCIDTLQGENEKLNHRCCQASNIIELSKNFALVYNIGDRTKIFDISHEWLCSFEKEKAGE